MWQEKLPFEVIDVPRKEHNENTKSHSSQQSNCVQSGTFTVMQALYTILISLIARLFPVAGIFSKKLELSVRGRQETMKILEKSLDKACPTLWLHAASLGEYEQGLPVMEALSKQYPEHQWVVTFFSPSGYEVKKNNAFAKVTTYLPLDTPSNVREFLDLVNPEIAFFVKYEFWPNYLNELNRRKIRTFLISGVFRESQPFFSWYGGWMKKSLGAFEHFFLQNQHSAEALQKLNFQNFTVSGDTRFDRVSHQIEMDNTLDFIEEFKGDSLCLVCGSTWPEDDAIITSYINDTTHNVKFIIAPHEIEPEKIAILEHKFNVETIRFSQKAGTSLQDARVLIIDTIGLLTKIYSYADIAYVGGAMGTKGLHNILEPATFGVPILIGANFDKFPEARKLQQLAGLYSVSNVPEFTERMDKLMSDKKFRVQTGMIAGHFVNSNTGATQAVLDYLSNNG